jgi:hypothetical protein
MVSALLPGSGGVPAKVAKTSLATSNTVLSIN